MTGELNISIADTSVKVFLKSGFFDYTLVTTVLHRHLYPEIHIIAAGNLLYRVGNKEFSLSAGDAVYIPRDVFHSCVSYSPDTVRFVFQTDMPYQEVSVKRGCLSSDFLNCFKTAVESVAVGKNAVKLQSILSLVCSEFISNDNFSLRPVSDRFLLIFEFFADNYAKDVTLKNLADELNLSTKQTEREIEKLTGKSFRDVITERRMQAAKILMNDGLLTASQIAEAVGYSSYSGFWKAYKKYYSKENTRT